MDPLRERSDDDWLTIGSINGAVPAQHVSPEAWKAEISTCSKAVIPVLEDENRMFWRCRSLGDFR